MPNWFYIVITNTIFMFMQIGYLARWVKVSVLLLDYYNLYFILQWSCSSTSIASIQCYIYRFNLCHRDIWTSFGMLGLGKPRSSGYQDCALSPEIPGSCYDRNWRAPETWEAWLYWQPVRNLPPLFHLLTLLVSWWICIDGSMPAVVCKYGIGLTIVIIYV